MLTTKKKMYIIILKKFKYQAVVRRKYNKQYKRSNIYFDIFY